MSLALYLIISPLYTWWNKRFMIVRASWRIVSSDGCLIEIIINNTVDLVYELISYHGRTFLDKVGIWPSSYFRRITATSSLKPKGIIVNIWSCQPHISITSKLFKIYVILSTHQHQRLTDYIYDNCMIAHFIPTVIVTIHRMLMIINKFAKLLSKPTISQLSFP